jgi:hypothetical protein
VDQRNLHLKYARMNCVTQFTLSLGLMIFPGIEPGICYSVGVGPFFGQIPSRSAQHQFDYCYTNSVCSSVCLSIPSLGSVKTVRDSALVTMES